MLSPVAGDVLDPEEFFDLVDELVTPAMAAVGYHRLGGVSNRQ